VAGLRLETLLALWQLPGGCIGTYAAPSDSAEGADAAPTWAWDGHSAVEVTAYDYNMCAIDSLGVIFCHGESRNGTTFPPTSALHVIDVGAYAACALDGAGNPQCWGCGTDVTGDGESSVDYGQCAAPTGSFIDVAAGSTANCALTTFGTIECWGVGAESLGATTSFLTEPAVDIAYAGTLCAVRTAGELDCLVLGDDLAAPPSGTFSRVEVGYDVACATRTDGTPACWGSLLDLSGVPTEPVLDIDANSASACWVLAADGTLGCVGGAAKYDQPPTGSYVSVAAGAAGGYAIRDDGLLVGWGLLDEPPPFGD
jgi:hypothetical protein